MKKRSTRLIIIFFAVLVAVLIARQFLVKKNVNGDNPATVENVLTIDTFSTFPPEIEGCACFFSNDSNEFKKGLYIYTSDFDKTSFLKINGVTTKFTITEVNQIDEKTTEHKAVSDEFEMTIKIIQGEHIGYESSLQSGSIILTDKKGNKITKEFYGECGC